MNESDGVEEALEGGMRVALAAAARIGETLARARQQQQERTAAESQSRARELTGRMQAEMTAARATYRGVDDPKWWSTAGRDDIATAYQNAVAWRGIDPEAARVERRIADEAETRHGVDVSQLVGSQGARATATSPMTDLDEVLFESSEFVNEAMSYKTTTKGRALELIERLDPEALRRHPEVSGCKGKDHDVDTALAAKAPDLFSPAELATIQEASPDSAVAEAVDVADATTLLQAADRADHAGVEDQVGTSAAEKNAWDSPERREATVRELSATVGDAQAVDAKMRADVSQAKPATEATRGAPIGSKARNARGGAGRGPVKDRGVGR